MISRIFSAIRFPARTTLLLVAFLLAIGPAIAFGMPTQAGPYKIDVTTDPAVVPVGKATLKIHITANGQPVAGAQVKALAQMPGMPMGEREQLATPDPGNPGTYDAPAGFSMAGGYDIHVSVNGPQGAATASVPIETGQNTTSVMGGVNWVGLLPWVLGFALLVVLLVRLRATGQKIDLKSLASKSVLGPLAILAIALLGTIYVVRHFRRPGSMTPVEAQTMQMNEPAPTGTTPVTLAVARNEDLQPSVTYSGQVVGYTEQDVVPRVTGTLIWMPFYVGNPVKKGQVLAKLDTSQSGPQVVQADAAVAAAQQGVNASQADYQQSLAALSEAEAEKSQYEGGLEEALAAVDAANEMKNQAESEIPSAEASVADAQAEVTSAQADVTYTAQQLQRSESLLSAGAISRQQYDRAKADSDKAQAALHQANEGVRSAQAQLTSAKAGVKRASADVRVAQKKVDQARSMVLAHHAHVATMQAAKASATQKVAQAESSVRQQQAMQSGASATEGYSTIRSQIDGVVTQRLATQGALLNEGRPILTIAQVSQVRLQANVPEADLARIKVGDQVKISHRGSNEAPLITYVTTISPSLDPVSRTGIVEAVVSNRDQFFLPGQFTTMQILVGRTQNAIAIPSAAVQTRAVMKPSQAGADNDDSGAFTGQSYVWIAKVSGEPNTYNVSRRDIELGDSVGDNVAVKHGLSDGDLVAVLGAQGLQEGERVAGQAPETRVATSGSIRVAENGFEPASLNVSSGQAVTLTFTRTTNATCATEVVFASLGIRKKLPLNRPIRIDLPAQKAGTLSYACGMNMLKGSVVVQ